MEHSETMQRPRILPLGDTAFTLSVEAAPGPVLSAALRDLGDRLLTEPGVLDTVQSFRTLTVFHAPMADRAALERTVIDGFTAEQSGEGEGRLWSVSGRFDPEAGPDQSEAAAALGIGVPALLDALIGSDWPVLAVGFIAGFPFLGPLPDSLKLPRRQSPRTRVPAGSIAIANGFCGIYPWVSPGGWHILGHTDFTLFDATDDPPARLAPGDRVRFERTA